MSLASVTNQRERDKFVEDASGDTAVRTLPTGGATSAKQDDILTELEQKTEPSDTQLVLLTDGTNNLYIWGSGGITTVKAIHWRIKESKEWLASNLWSAVDDGNSVYLHIKTDATKAAHGNVVIESEGKLEVRLFENPTLSDDGTELEDLSLNRETISAAATKVYKDPGVTSDGTEIEVGVLGTPGKFTAAGGDITGGYWLLKPNEDYLVKVTNIAGAAIDIVIKYGWHENVAV